MMIQDAYSSDTGEHIPTDNPAGWMGRAGVAAPVFDPATSGCFWRNNAWLIVAADLLTPAKAAQIAVLESAYAAAIQQSVAYMSTTFQADTASQDTLTKVLVAGGAVPYWLDANNAQIAVTPAQLQGLAAAMLAQGQVAFAHLQVQKAAVKAATTVAQAQGVVW